MENKDIGPLEGSKTNDYKCNQYFYDKSRSGTTQFLRNLLQKTIMKGSQDPENLNTPK